MKLRILLLNISLFFFVCTLSCSSNSVNSDNTNMEIDDSSENEESMPEEKNALKILSLGDSYTIGASVCDTCRFPEQLKDSIADKIENLDISLKVIATTGWTTTNLKNALPNQDIEEDYDLATLLIGVNNQFENKPFNIFETEFPELVSEAIKHAKGKKENLIVISIPDYAFTPFGNGNSNITEGINAYNTFIENYCNQYAITYVYITDITREGLDKPELVAPDGLHPSTLAYSKFIERILPEALEKIGHTNE